MTQFNPESTVDEPKLRKIYCVNWSMAMFFSEEEFHFQEYEESFSTFEEACECIKKNIDDGVEIQIRVEYLDDIEKSEPEDDIPF